MGRIRSIKPEFFKDDDLFELEKHSGFPIRLAFAGLWTIADREGRFVWKIRPLKTDILPYDDLNFEDVLNALVNHRFIVFYEVAGKRYGWIRNFRRHQRVRTDEARSLIPPCPDEDQTPGSCEPVPAQITTRTGADNNRGRGKERKGKEGRGEGIHPPPNFDQENPEEIKATPKAAASARIVPHGTLNFNNCTGLALSFNPFPSAAGVVMVPVFPGRRH